MTDMVFTVGLEVKRSDLHSRFGGSRYSGISQSAQTGAIFLFTGPHGAQYGYEDRFDSDGMFLYTGEGQTGEMKFIRSNRALRDHEAEQRRVFLFEQTRKGYVRFVAEVRCDGFHFQLRPDRNGQPRKAIVYHLEVINSGGGSAPSGYPCDDAEDPRKSSLNRFSLAELRSRALYSSSNSSDSRRRTISVKIRADAIRQYALRRAAGNCESCHQPAPFKSKVGAFLEVHHLYRLSDGGPDHPAAVAALCPNCHREIHDGINGADKNQSLIQFIGKIEESLSLSP